jgi:hypothetical protein
MSLSLSSVWGQLHPLMDVPRLERSAAASMIPLQANVVYFFSSNEI